MLFSTTYRTHKGTLQYTQCYARSQEHLEEVMALRGMGERHSGGMSTPSMPSTLLAEGKYAAAHHAMTWVAMIATRAKIASAWELLSDDGILHAMAHEAHAAEIPRTDFFGDFFAPERRRKLVKRIEAFERLTPGMHPSWGDETPDIDVTATLQGVLAGGQSFDAALDEIVSRIENQRYKLQSAAYYILGDSGMLKNYAIRDEYGMEEAGKANAPSAKIGSRKFEEHQRNQGAAVKAKTKADLVAKIKKNAQIKRHKIEIVPQTMSPGMLEEQSKPRFTRKFDAFDAALDKLADSQSKSRFKRETAEVSLIPAKIVNMDYNLVEKHVLDTLALKSPITVAGERLHAQMLRADDAVTRLSETFKDLGKIKYLGQVHDEIQLTMKAS